MSDSKLKDNSIRNISASSLTGNRMKAIIDMAENHSNPNLEMKLLDANKKEVSRSLILGVIGTHIEFTLHIRATDPIYPLTLSCTTYTDETNPIDLKIIEIANSV